ncbi:endonuclease/exonuclease/phosphatase family protein [Streptomyces sp. CB02115]|uniref:endonuclease/exonuclease/phosphatase family protein n=1 Tax=Streptomyces sp. CB02115 TaxID=1703939 RepID=UPI00093EF75D|nr:endonuclease/exonuclease/phosphatase family protein [Streptomyces sp. CB02115]OKJ58718.1 hypothetical protein AMK28_06300 [Streptomyces sp. CB02115]
MGLSRGFGVATYNIWGTGVPHRYWRDRSVLRGAVEGSPGLGLDREETVWAARREGLVRALREAGPDLVALQEVVDPAGGGRDRAHELAERLGYHVAPSGAGFTGGLAVLSRDAVLGCRQIPLRSTEGAFGGHPVVLEVEVAAARLWVVHVPVGPDAVRAARIAELGTLAASAPSDRPLLLCGDFNCPADGAPMRDLLAGGELADAWTEGGGDPRALTMPMPGPTWRLDYVLYRPADGLTAGPGGRLLGTEPDAEGLFPSDHCGVAVRFV